jgi:alpha-tubulin suppressor-like RCC1 family protein
MKLSFKGVVKIKIIVGRDTEMNNFNNSRLYGRSLPRVGLVFGLLLTATLICLAVFQFKNAPSLAFQATAVSPDSGSVVGGQQITITGLFDERDKIKEVYSASLAALALSENGQVYFWGHQGFGYDGIGGPCVISGDSYDHGYNQADCENASGVWYPDRDLPAIMTTPVSINQIAAGAIGPSTVIKELSVSVSDSMGIGYALALDDQGQAYFWGYNFDYDDDNKRPINLNLLGGDVTPDTEIKQVFATSDGYSFPQPGIMVGSDETVYGFGDLWRIGLVNPPCDVGGYDDEQDCIDNGGAWNQQIGDFFNNPHIPTDLTGISDLANINGFQKIDCDVQYSRCYVLDADGHIWANGGMYDPELHDINQAASGDITLATKIVDIAVSRETLFAVDDQGQLYIMGKDLESNDYTVPTNLSQAGFGDIDQSVKLVKIDDSITSSYFDGFLAIDDQGQVYSYSRVNAGDGYEYSDSPKPINISAVAAGDLNSSVNIVSVNLTNFMAGFSYAVGADGQVYRWGGNSSYEPAQLIYPCDVSGNTYLAYDQADCESAGGIWDPEKDLNPLVPSEITKFGVFGDMSEPDYIVTIDGEACENVALVDKNTITCTVPAHVAGLVDIAITDNLGNSETLQQAYTYEAPNPGPNPNPNPEPNPGAPIVPGVPNTGYELKLKGESND